MAWATRKSHVSAVLHLIPPRCLFLQWEKLRLYTSAPSTTAWDSFPENTPGTLNDGVSWIYKHDYIQNHYFILIICFCFCLISGSCIGSHKSASKEFSFSFSNQMSNAIFCCWINTQADPVDRPASLELTSLLKVKVGYYARTAVENEGEDC